MTTIFPERAMADELPLEPQWTKPRDYPSISDWLQGEFAWNNPTLWTGPDGYVRLGGARVARISLDGEAMDRFQVTIIHKEQGILDRKEFLFAEHLRPLQQPGAGIVDLPLRAYGARGARSCFWQIAVPESTGPLVEAIERHLELFR
jgi:hypothetical protein